MSAYTYIHRERYRRYLLYYYFSRVRRSNTRNNLIMFITMTKYNNDGLSKYYIKLSRSRLSMIRLLNLIEFYLYLIIMVI